MSHETRHVEFHVTQSFLLPCWHLIVFAPRACCWLVASRWLSKHASLQVTVPLRNASALDPGVLLASSSRSAPFSHLGVWRNLTCSSPLP